MDKDKTAARMQFATPLPEAVHRSEAVQTRLLETRGVRGWIGTLFAPV